MILNREKLKVLYSIGIILVIITIVVLYFLNKDEDYELVEPNDIAIIETKEEKLIKVYITGEVNKPGVIELKEGSRIEDAINEAEGITENANLDRVNLAYVLEDGQKIHIPNSAEEIEIVSTENGENVILSNTTNGKININSANVEELCKISGIGESLANKIIIYRNQNGKFKSLEDLKNVSGIGDKKFESIKDFVVVK